ncbi:MAG: 50S ribosomal protein L1 [Candidatus Cloacimonadota bacterium]|nr:MAG: 50S ribosomal protein L1 [Candidatus Cloacimonadota bacterium]
MKRSRRYNEASKLTDHNKYYDLSEALGLLKSFPALKFDQTVELHFHTGVDPRKADQQIRNSLVLPNGTGKQVTVLVFAEGEKAEEAKAAGADYVGLDDLVEKIQGGWTDFDVAVATPNLMGKIGRLGRILGPRSLMPNPKVGTVTMDVAKAVNESKGGKVAYRIDKFSNLHIPVGKISFEADKLKENILTVVSAILREKPATVKGTYIKSITLAATMSPSVKLDVSSVSTEAKK